MITPRMGCLSKTASGPTVQKFLHDPLHHPCLFFISREPSAPTYYLLILLYFSASFNPAIFNSFNTENGKLETFVI